MARNIVIFSDGTGQRGGVLFDECRSNIYKLYRAARSAPDSRVDAAEQYSFYDAGIGTLPSGIGVLPGVFRWLYNVICQATGLGLTGNIIDCYTQIIRHWRPGDRIFLFGFSRGAYTVRCVAAVLAFCGVPTRMKDGSPMRRDQASCRRLAREAVTRVYQHVSSEKDRAYLGQRRALAERFRRDYASGDAEGPNVYPHFVGVFDTVAALSNPGALVVMAILGALAVLGLAGIASAFGASFWSAAGWILLASATVGGVLYVGSHLKVAFGLPDTPWWKTAHFTSPRMRFYDTLLNPNVGWARHALAIDEHRADFDRVPWGNRKDQREVAPGEPDWLKQLWFAGCHSDVGGSYPESESRLSDISLQWMVEEALAVPDGLKIDQRVLRLYPDSGAMQHDETRKLAFRFAKRLLRRIPNDAVLHGSVAERLALPVVQQYDVDAPYRPENLRNHVVMVEPAAASDPGESVAMTGAGSPAPVEIAAGPPR